MIILAIEVLVLVCLIAVAPIIISFAFVATRSFWLENQRLKRLAAAEAAGRDAP